MTSTDDPSLGRRSAVDVQRRNDGALYVEKSGGGDETVVLLHGLAGSSRYFHTLVAALASRPESTKATSTYRFVAPDLLGFGRSPWPSIDYTVDAHLDALERDVFSRIEGPFHLVGHSTGAMLALEQAARRPAQTKSLSLLALPYFDDDAQARRLISGGGGWPWLMLNMPRFSSFMCSCICGRRRFWSHILPVLLRRLPREVVVDGMMHTYQSISSTMRECILGRRLDAAALRVADTPIPVAQLYDEGDQQIPPERARIFHERYPWSTLHPIDGGGHGFPLDAATTTARIVAANIGAVRPATP